MIRTLCLAFLSFAMTALTAQNKHFEPVNKNTNTSMAACSEKAVQCDASIAPYRDGKQCAISFTYDDGMLCHYTDVAPELEKRGFRGTFWIIGNNMGKDEPGYPWMTWDQVADMAKRGHEMSNHTWTHPSLPSLTTEEVKQELAHCDSVLESVTGKKPITMAYPYNAMSPEVVALCEEGRVGTRTYQVGHGQAESHTTLDSMNVWLDDLLKTGEWGVTMTHGTTYGWDMWEDPSVLYQFFDVVKAKEDSVWVGTFAEVAAYIKERDAAQLMVGLDKHAVTITVTHTLDASLYQESLTVSLKSEDWQCKNITAEQDGQSVTVITRGNELLVNVKPGENPLTLRW